MRRFLKNITVHTCRRARLQPYVLASVFGAASQHSRWANLRSCCVRWRHRNVWRCTVHRADQCTSTDGACGLEETMAKWPERQQQFSLVRRQANAGKLHYYTSLATTVCPENAETMWSPLLWQHRGPFILRLSQHTTLLTDVYVYFSYLVVGRAQFSLAFFCVVGCWCCGAHCAPLCRRLSIGSCRYLRSR